MRDPVELRTARELVVCAFVVWRGGEVAGWWGLVLGAAAVDEAFGLL